MSVTRSGHGLVCAAAVAAAVPACSQGGPSRAAGRGPDDGGASADAAADAAVDPHARLVAVELADEAALARLAGWRAIPVLGDGRYEQQSSADPSPDDPAPEELLERGNRDTNVFVCRSADAQVAATQRVPLRYRLSECPETYARGVVTARFEGTGRLSRLWMTTFSRIVGAPGNEVLRIYVDDDPVPRVQVPLQAVFDGTAGEFFAAPFGAEARTHVAWHYPVVFGSKLVVALDELTEDNLYYHQEDVVFDGRSHAAAPARLPGRDAAKEVLARARKVEGTQVLGAWTGPVAPGAAADALDLAGPATVHRIEAGVASADLPLLEDVQLEVFWDGGAAAALSVPLVDLFAASHAPPNGSGHVLSSREESGRTVLSLQLPMPFDHGARWRLTSAAATSVDVTLTAWGEPSVPAEPFGRLHAERHETIGPTAGPTHPIAAVTGRGRLAGVCAVLEGHALDLAQGSLPLNYLEGDEIGLVDGDPAILGTGTEDYFDSSFYFLAGPFATSFAQAWDIDFAGPGTPPRGLVSACRWHVLTEAVDFRTSLDLDLEIGPGHPELLDSYRTIAFIYR